MSKHSHFKALSARKLPKTDREQAVLLGLLELYLKTNKPIGSQTLQENGFGSLSTATIRNYFCKMEAAGYLKQPHTSGGRVPTAKAFRLYADHYKNSGTLNPSQEKDLRELFQEETREVASIIHQTAESLSAASNCAVFVSAPRFEHDFLHEIRLIRLGNSKLLSVLITEFGLVRTETLYIDEPMGASFLRTAEEYFLWRMNRGEKPLFLNSSEAKLAQRIYNEILVRHVIGYANAPSEEILRTGFSKLLAYEEFNDAAALAGSLHLLEDVTHMRQLLRQCIENKALSSWIGEELSPYVPKDVECTVLAIPYRIHQTPIGAIALLGPMRLQYRNAFGLLQAYSEAMSQTLTDRLYKFKISFRGPDPHNATLQSAAILLDNKPRNV